VKSSANDTYGIDIRTAITTTGGNLSLNSESLALASALSASGTVTLTSTSAITYNQPITANQLNLLGNGATYSFTNTANNVGRLTGNTGAITYVDANALTLGPSTSTGEVQISTQSGDLTLDGNLATSSTTSSAVVLNAGKSAAIGTTTGGNILVSGSPTVTTGSGGIAKLFSGSDTGSTGLIGLVGGISNSRIGVDETSSTFSPSLSAGASYALFRMLSSAPNLTGLNGDAVTYNQEGNPVALDLNTNAQVADPDSFDFNGGVLTVSFISNTGVAAEDRLAVTNQGSGTGQIGISGANVLYEGAAIGTFSGGSSGNNLVITLNASSDATKVQALVRALTYANLNTTLSIVQTNRQIQVTLSDGDGGISSASVVTVSIGVRTLSIVSGNNQTGPVNQALGAGPILKVLNTDGTPAANVSLNVTASAGQISRPVLSNLSNSYATGGSSITNINWKAHQFTTGSTSITLDKVDLVLNVADSILTSPLVPYSYPKTVQVEAAIYSLVNGLPAVEIGTSGIQSALLPATATWKSCTTSRPCHPRGFTSPAFLTKSAALRPAGLGLWPSLTTL
jgi:hypothetical protein